MRLVTCLNQSDYSKRPNSETRPQEAGDIPARGVRSPCDRLQAHTVTEKHGMATSIRLSPETERRLAFLAAQTGRTRAFYLREIIDRGLEDIKDYYLAADVLERVRKGQEQVHSNADVMEGLGLEDAEEDGPEPSSTP